MGGQGAGPSLAQVLRLVAAYGLDVEAPAERERPPYVPYCDDLGVREYQPMSRERLLWASRLWAEGMSIKAIARELGVSPVTIGGQTCRHRELFPHRNRRRK